MAHLKELFFVAPTPVQDEEFRALVARVHAQYPALVRSAEPAPSAVSTTKPAPLTQRQIDKRVPTAHEHRRALRRLISGTVLRWTGVWDVREWRLR